MSRFLSLLFKLGMSPYITWMLPYLLVVSFAGLFSIVALRKMMIMKYKLTYPSGIATAYLINCFHTPKRARLAKKQVGSLFTSFGFSYIFGVVHGYLHVLEAADLVAWLYLVPKPMPEGSILFLVHLHGQHIIVN